MKKITSFDKNIVWVSRGYNNDWIKFKKSENDPVTFEKYKEMQRRSQYITKSAKQNFEQKLEQLYVNKCFQIRKVC